MEEEEATEALANEAAKAVAGAPSSNSSPDSPTWKKNDPYVDCSFALLRYKGKEKND